MALEHAGRRARWAVVTAAAALCLAHAAAPASAGEPAPRCGARITGKVTLKADLTCASGHGLMLDGAAALDCAGHRVIGGNKTGQYGIYVRDTAHAVVKRCVVEHFEVGIRLRGAMQARVIRNVARDNLRYGVEVTHGSSGVLIQANTIAGNGDEGIHVSGPEDVDADHQILDNTVAGNENEGIYLLRSNGSLIDGNTIRDQGTAGIYVKESSRNTISGNTLVNDPLQLVYGAQRNVLSDNTIVGQALKLNQASHNQVRRLIVKAHAGRPSIAYDFTNSSGNRVVDSEAVNPEDYGIRVKNGSVDNAFRRLVVQPWLRCSVDTTSSVSVTGPQGAPLPCP
jgi:parallel beta-helix repeat protein